MDGVGGVRMQEYVGKENSHQERRGVRARRQRTTKQEWKLQCVGKICRKDYKFSSIEHVYSLLDQCIQPHQLRLLLKLLCPVLAAIPSPILLFCF